LITKTIQESILLAAGRTSVPDEQTSKSITQQEFVYLTENDQLEELGGSKPGMKLSRVVKGRLTRRMPVSPRFRGVHSCAR
jgi:hypothetical protein